MELIRVQDATLKTDRVLATNVSFTVTSRSRRTIVGANGSGKTTLLRALVEARNLPSEHIRFAPGIRLAFVTQHEQRPPGDVGFFVTRQLRPLKEAERNMTRLASLASAGSASLERYQEALDVFEALGDFDAPERIERRLAEIGIEPTQQLDELTDEEWQLLRLALAVSLPHDVLLLDEPTTGLHADAAERVRYWLLRYEGAIIAVTHDRAFIRTFGGTVHELTTHGLRPFTLPKRLTRTASRAEWDAAALIHHQLDGESFIVRAGDRVVFQGGGETMFRELEGSAPSSAIIRSKHALTLRRISDEPVATPTLTWLTTGSVPGAPEKILTELGLPFHRWSVPVAQLSGGEQRRVHLARAMLDEAEVILWENATKALDLPGIMRIEAALIRYTTETGAALLFTATDREFVQHVANREWPHQVDSNEPGPPLLHPLNNELVSHQEEIEQALLRLESALSSSAPIRERTIRRLHAERTSLTEAVLEHINATLPPPRARFRIIEGATEWFADTLETGVRSWVGTDPHGEDPAIVLHHFNNVGHMHSVHDANPAAVNALTHYAFTIVGLHAVQFQYEPELPGVLLERSGSWLRLTRDNYEQLGGWNARPR